MTSSTTEKPRRVSEFGALLKGWRKARGISQLDLSLHCGVSQRHVSFLESGRSQPSRGMVLHLGEALGVPLRQQNALLIAAGFAPVYRARSLDAPEMRQVSKALDRAIAQQEPFPAIAIDHNYNLLRANMAASRFMALMLGPAAAEALSSGAAVNVAHLMLSPEGLRPHIQNWDEAASWMIRRLRAEAVRDGSKTDTDDLLTQLMALPDVADLAFTPRDDVDPSPTLVVRFNVGGATLALFSMIATLGTPLDTSLQEMHLEFFFPGDEATEAWFRNMADAPDDPVGL